VAFDYGLLSAKLVTDRRERWLLAIVSDMTLFIIPIALLLFIQLQFLAYHSAWNTWIHRGLLASDLVLIFTIQRWMETPSSRTAKSLKAHFSSVIGSIWTSLVNAHRRVMGVLSRFAHRLSRKRDVKAPHRSSSMYSDVQEGADAVADYVWALNINAMLERLLDPWVLVPILWRLLLAVAVLAGSLVVLTFPGEPTDILWSRYQPAGGPLAGKDVAETYHIHRSLLLRDRTFWSKEPPPEVLAAFEHSRLDHPADAARTEYSDEINHLPSRAWLVYGTPVDLRGRNLEYANFEHSRLIGANLSGADTHMEHADFAHADLEHANFSGATLPDVDFTDARLELANFSNASMPRAQLTDAQGTEAIFNGADMRAAKLNGSDLTGAYFVAAILRGVDCQDLASLMGANLQGADLSDAGFRATRFYGANLFGALLYGTDFDHVYMLGADLREARARGATFYGSDLTDVEFSGANLEGARFDRVYLLGAQFGGSDLHAASFVRVHARGTDFQSADITLASFIGIDLDSTEAASDPFHLAEDIQIPDPRLHKEFDQRVQDGTKAAGQPGGPFTGAYGSGMWSDGSAGRAPADLQPAANSATYRKQVWAYLAGLPCSDDIQPSDAAKITSADRGHAVTSGLVLQAISDSLGAATLRSSPCVQRYLTASEDRFLRKAMRRHRPNGGQGGRTHEQTPPKAQIGRGPLPSKRSLSPVTDKTR
jgi:uncharacterized protein YjbI with pentapeptide repeats